MLNENTWNARGIDEVYSYDTELQAPEKTIFNHLKNGLAEMDMLDIGVGAGRTTQHFAKRVKSYVGVDYSDVMINACKKNFSEYPESTSFEVCDVRSMEMFDDNSFDFILFSFNGLDYISHSDRLKSFKEINRIAKPGAFFCFSTHNILCADNIFSLKHQLCLNPKRLLRNVYNWGILKLKYNKGINTQQLKHANYAIFNDGAENFGLETYYIKPVEQIKQLTEDNLFKDIRAYSLSNGEEIKSEEQLHIITDPWIYYSMTVE